MNKYLKFLIAALLLALGIWLIASGKSAFWGSMLIVLTAVPIFLFFRNEYILLAFWQMRKQNLEGAKKWLHKVSNLETQLVKNQYGYYHYMLGLTQGQENISKSESYMKKALEYGLNFDHDKAMANLNLAASSLAKGRKNEAQNYLKKAQDLDTKNMLKDHIKMIKEQAKKVNVGRNLHNPNMRKRGKHF